MTAHDLISLPGLAAELATRLVPYLPDQVEVVADGSSVVVTGKSSERVAAIELDPSVERLTMRLLAQRAEHVLERIQDFVIEELTQAWPGVGDAPGVELPLAYADVHEARLALGYRRGEVQVALAPIELRKTDSPGK